MQLTDEQAELVRCVGNGRNVHSNSCPGGGKTTTLKRAIDALPLDETAGGPTVLVLCYNRSIREAWQHDMRGRASILCHTFHSLAKQMLRIKGMPTDTDLTNLCERLDAHGPSAFDDDVLDASKTRRIRHVLIDEAQDVSHHLKRVLDLLLLKLGHPVQMVVVGDEMQRIKTMDPISDMRASDKYLIHPEAHFPTATRGDWASCRLTVSMRLRPRIANFINFAFELTHPIVAGLTDEEGKVDYHIVNTFDPATVRQQILDPLVREYGVGNVMIVTDCKSDCGGRPANRFINLISDQQRYIVYRPGETANNGLEVQSYMTCKGLEKRCTVVFGAGEFGYNMTKYQKYVAWTRASHHLVLLHECTTPFFQPYWNKRLLGAYATVRVHHEFRPRPVGWLVPKVYAVTEVVGVMNRPLDRVVEECRSSTVLLKGGALPFHVVPPPTFQVQAGGETGTFSTPLSAVYGVGVVFYGFARRGHLPKNYARIFEPVCVSGRSDEFMRDALDLMEGMRTEEARQLQSEVASVLRKHKQDPKRGEQLRAWGLPDHPKEDDFVHFVRHRIRPEAKNSVISESKYAFRFPTAKRRQLEGLIPREPSEWNATHAMRAAVASEAFNGDHVLLQQITDYAWVDEEGMAKAAERLLLPEHFEDEVHAECIFSPPIRTEGRPREILGVECLVDAVLADGCLCEFKHSVQTNEEHRRQAVLNAILHRRTHGTAKPILLMNTCTGEVETYDVSGLSEQRERECILGCFPDAMNEHEVTLSSSSPFA